MVLKWGKVFTVLSLRMFRQYDIIKTHKKRSPVRQYQTSENALELNRSHADIIQQDFLICQPLSKFFQKGGQRQKTEKADSLTWEALCARLFFYTPEDRQRRKNEKNYSIYASYITGNKIVIAILDTSNDVMEYSNFQGTPETINSPTKPRRP